MPKIKNLLKRKKDRNEIIIDYREKNSFVPAELISGGYNTEFMELKVADYLVKDVAIERKTVSDFITSIKNKRLVKQLEELQQYKHRLLIIEGIDEEELYTEENFGMHPNSIRGFILSILLKYKTPIIFTKNAKDTAEFISVLYKKREIGAASINVSKKALN